MSNDSDDLPLYVRVEAALASDIASSMLRPGDRLPCEEKLIARFRVSRTTVRKAVERLIARGIVEIRRGKGTFVAEPKITQDLTELRGFVEDMAALGRTPTAKVLAKEPTPASRTVAEHLGLLPGIQVYRIERVRLANGVAMSFDETYLPLEIGKKVASNDLEAEPIFSLLENKYDIPLIEARYQLEAVTADEKVASALGIKIGSPIFLIERTSYTDGMQPIDYEKLYYRADLIKFVTKLIRNHNK